MLSDEQMLILHRKTGATKQQIVECERYQKSHPYDCLQPGEKGYDTLWGNRTKKQTDKIEKAKKEAEMMSQEMNLWKQRKGGMDKVHRKYTIR